MHMGLFQISNEGYYPVEMLNFISVQFLHYAWVVVFPKIIELLFL